MIHEKIHENSQQKIQLVRVVKSPRSMWYDSKIGRVFAVVKEESDRVWVREGDEYNLLNYILKSDLEFVNYEKEKP